MSLEAGLLTFFSGCAAPAGSAAPAPPVRKTMITFEEIAGAPAPPPDYRESYGPETLQFGELRLPKTATRVPVVVFLHGGCWRAAYDLAHVTPLAAALAAAGYAVWVPEYRRVGDAGGGWPGTFDDVAAAVDHVRALASRHAALDTTRVIVAGHSAGGQLALWVASRKPGEVTPGTAPGTEPLQLKGVLSLAGITDLAGYASPSGCGSAVVPLMGGTASEVPDRYRRVSPVARVPLGVPVEIVHGSADPIVPIAASRALAARLRIAGNPVTLTEVDGAGHFDVVAPQSAAWTAVVAAVRALVPIASRIEVVEQNPPDLRSYGGIPIAFTVREILDYERDASSGHGRFALTPRAVVRPWVKDYDEIDGGPATWASRFDLSHWRIFVAHERGEVVGGAAVVFRAPRIDLLGGRDDMALLWDIRVAPARRGTGIGSALMWAVEAWSAAHGAAWLEVETQNINAPACRFYERHGFTLRDVNPDAYPALPGEVQLIWSKHLDRLDAPDSA